MPVRRLTPDSTRRLSQWRDEIDAVLEATRKTLAPLEAEHGTAIAASDALRVSHRDLQRALGAIKLPENLLLARSHLFKREVDAAAARREQARLAIEVAHDRIAELERARAQIDRLLAPVEETEIAPEAV